MSRSTDNCTFEVLELFQLRIKEYISNRNSAHSQCRFMDNLVDLLVRSQELEPVSNKGISLPLLLLLGLEGLQYQLDPKSSLHRVLRKTPHVPPDFLAALLGHERAPLRYFAQVTWQLPPALRIQVLLVLVDILKGVDKLTPFIYEIISIAANGTSCIKCMDFNEHLTGPLCQNIMTSISSSFTLLADSISEDDMSGVHQSALEDIFIIVSKLSTSFPEETTQLHKDLQTISIIYQVKPVTFNQTCLVCEEKKDCQTYPTESVKTVCTSLHLLLCKALQYHCIASTDLRGPVLSAEAVIAAMDLSRWCHWVFHWKTFAYKYGLGEVNQSILNDYVQRATRWQRTLTDWSETTLNSAVFHKMSCDYHFNQLLDKPAKSAHTIRESLLWVLNEAEGEVSQRLQRSIDLHRRHLVDEAVFEALWSHCCTSVQPGILEVLLQVYCELGHRSHVHYFGVREQLQVDSRTVERCQQELTKSVNRLVSLTEEQGSTDRLDLLDSVKLLMGPALVIPELTVKTLLVSAANSLGQPIGVAKVLKQLDFVADSILCWRYFVDIIQDYPTESMAIFLVHYVEDPTNFIDSCLIALLEESNDGLHRFVINLLTKLLTRHSDEIVKGDSFVSILLFVTLKLESNFDMFACDKVKMCLDLMEALSLMPRSPPITDEELEFLYQSCHSAFVRSTIEFYFCKESLPHQHSAPYDSFICSEISNHWMQQPKVSYSAVTYRLCEWLPRFDAAEWIQCAHMVHSWLKEGLVENTALRTIPSLVTCSLTIADFHLICASQLFTDVTCLIFACQQTSQSHIRSCVQVIKEFGDSMSNPSALIPMVQHLDSLQSFSKHTPDQLPLLKLEFLNLIKLANSSLKSKKSANERSAAY